MPTEEDDGTVRRVRNEKECAEYASVMGFDEWAAVLEIDDETRLAPEQVVYRRPGDSPLPAVRYVPVPVAFALVLGIEDECVHWEPVDPRNPDSSLRVAVGRARDFLEEDETEGRLVGKTRCNAPLRVECWVMTAEKFTRCTSKAAAQVNALAMRSLDCDLNDLFSG